jgi:DNA (cytosine-5)-methyltransferase 1
VKFIDLFSGIGGFRLGMEMAGHECVGYIEIDKYARQSYKAIHNTKGEWTSNDIRAVDPWELPESDCYTAGFPDWAFRKAKDAGISDTQLYKQAGNAISVPVVYEIAKRFKEAN